MKRFLITAVLALSALPAYAAEAPEAGLSRLPATSATPIWTLVVFVIVVVVLGKFAWGPVLGVLREREDFIHKSLSDAKRDREDAERAQGLLREAPERQAESRGDPRGSPARREAAARGTPRARPRPKPTPYVTKAEKAESSSKPHAPSSRFRGEAVDLSTSQSRRSCCSGTCRRKTTSGSLPRLSPKSRKATDNVKLQIVDVSECRWKKPSAFESANLQSELWQFQLTSTPPTRSFRSQNLHAYPYVPVSGSAARAPRFDLSIICGGKAVASLVERDRVGRASTSRCTMAVRLCPASARSTSSPPGRVSGARRRQMRRCAIT